MILTRAALTEYDSRIRFLGDSAYDLASRLVSSYIGAFPDASVSEARAFAVESVTDVVSAYGDAVATCAADLYDQMAESAGVELAPAVLDTSDVAGFIEKEIRYQARLLVDGDISGFAEAVAKKAKYQTQRRANSTMMRNAERDGLRYARVPMGAETCTFCMMLASRGFVYKSAKTAGEGVHYHDGCRCKVVPSFSRRGKATTVEGYDPNALYRLWRKFEEIDAANEEPYLTRQSAKRILGLDGELSSKEALHAARTGGITPLLRSAADPAADVYGAAEDEDGEKLQELKTWLKDNGVVVKTCETGAERIGYDPGLGSGERGSLIATQGMSLSAWMHEADHARYDIENGLPGLAAYLCDTELRVRMEERAYGLEIEKAVGDGYNELADRLRTLRDAEVRRLRGEDDG